ncbi:MAG: Ppx/GppA family phosphatase [Actinobacteria bacterium]|nr:Ppx/GppA family phosphatase [Actinomycetota bacterium]
MAPPIGSGTSTPFPEVLAAIDIGTNSVHMVVARVAGNDRFEVITRLKEMVRLGSGRGEMSHLEPDAVDRTVDALTRCRQLAAAHDATVFAVATSAVREARNAEEFLARAREEAGVDVEVISGHEEARLIRLGALQALPLWDRDMVLVDVGGGSTEIVFGRREVVDYARSIKLGSLRMTRSFFPDGVVEPGAVASCRRFVRGRLAPMLRDASGHAFDVAVATSGTAEALTSMAIAGTGDPTPQTLNGAVLTRTALGAVIEDLAAATTTEQRRRIPGIDDARADILLGGAIVVEQVCDALGIEELVVSEYALREGVLLDGLHRLRGGSLHHLSELRAASVHHLVELCDDDPEHSYQVRNLVLQLHDALGGRLGLDDDDRELLHAAALLANVGLFISHSAHHKHSYYVIRNSEHLMGFTDREIELIAQVARYHRKSRPSDKHPEFAALDDADRSRVRAMAAMLRVAIGMDRNHDGAVDRVVVKDEGGVVRVELVGTAGADLSLESYTASERSGLLSEVLAADIEVTVG